MLILLHIVKYGDRSGFVSGLENIECWVTSEYVWMAWYTLGSVGIFGFFYMFGRVGLRWGSWDFGLS